MADHETSTRPVGRGDARRLGIERAAIEQFSTKGLSATSMADIARAAGISRPALYQYFRDKSDLFASAFVNLFEEHVDRALEELDGPGTAAERLDGFLQRYHGDLWQRMAASPHTDELIGAKDDAVSTAVAAVVDRLWAGLEIHLRGAAPGRSAAATSRRANWLILLRLSPIGLRSDHPSVDDYRRRLTALAETIAGEIDRR